MTKTMLMAAAAVFVLTAATSAHAADDWRKGLYVKGGAGWNHAQDQSYTSGASSLDVEMDEGYVASGAVGYDFGDMRSELEIAYRDNDVDSADINGASAAGVGGNLNSTAFMLNGYYDIPTGSPITPYVGAGIGVANVDVDGYTAGGTAVSGDDNVFAYQAIAGAEYAVDSQTALFTEYKYFATEDVEADTAIGTTTDLDNDNHTLMAGVKYSFN